MESSQLVFRAAEKGAASVWPSTAILFGVSMIFSVTSCRISRAFGVGSGAPGRKHRTPFGINNLDANPFARDIDQNLIPDGMQFFVDGAFQSTHEIPRRKGGPLASGRLTCLFRLSPDVGLIEA